jgi:hypothetical protein
LTKPELRMAEVALPIVRYGPVRLVVEQQCTPLS